MKTNDIAIIRNTTISGRAIIEGTAKLLHIDDDNLPNHWVVEFVDEPGARYSRFVLDTDIQKP